MSRVTSSDTPSLRFIHLNYHESFMVKMSVKYCWQCLVGISQHVPFYRIITTVPTANRIREQELTSYLTRNISSARRSDCEPKRPEDLWPGNTTTGPGSLGQRVCRKGLLEQEGWRRVRSGFWIEVRLGYTRRGVGRQGVGARKTEEWNKTSGRGDPLNNPEPVYVPMNLLRLLSRGDLPLCSVSHSRFLPFILPGSSGCTRFNHPLSLLFLDPWTDSGSSGGTGSVSVG